jgi:hypothetical protein
MEAHDSSGLHSELLRFLRASERRDILDELGSRWIGKRSHGFEQRILGSDLPCSYVDLDYGLLPIAEGDTLDP